MKTLIISALFTGLLSTNLFADPVGQMAGYKIDKSRDRTSSMIIKGAFNTEVVDFSPEGQDGPAYSTNLDYDITIQYMGRKQGTSSIEAPAEFFTPEFFVKLREAGTLEYPQFKVEHMGYEDAVNEDGASYPNCDKIFIYDIDTNRAGALTWIVEAFASMAQSSKGDIEDLELTALVSEGIPVLGAVKLDVTGTASGYDFFAGADYNTPAVK